MAQQRFRILIIDDEIKIVQLIRNLIDWDNLPLELAGTANDGVQALQLIGETRPDIVILDIRMPGFTGLDIISRVKEENRNIHFVIVSGYRHFEYAHNAIKFGVEDYLLKPVKAEELNGTLRKIIDKKKSRVGAEENLLDALLSGSFSADRTSGIKTGYPCYELVLLKNDLNSGEVNENEISLLFEKSLTAIKSCFADRRINFWSAGGKKGIYILLNYREGDGRYTANYLFNLIESLHSYRDLFSALTSTVARSGTFNDLGDFRAMADKVEQLIPERYVQGCGIVLERMKSHDSPGLRDIFPPSLKTEFSRKIEVLDGEGTADAVRDLYGSLKREKASGVLIVGTLDELFRIFIYNLENHYDVKGEVKGAIERYGEVLSMQSSDSVLYDLAASHFRTVLENLQKERQNRDDKPILDAKKYINENFFLNLSLEDVSASVGMNPTYLSSLFKKKTGMGFVEYLTQVRIDEARELLADHKRSIADTAGEVGYRDPKHFAKQFKKIVGLSPADYRKIYY